MNDKTRVTPGWTTGEKYAPTLDAFYETMLNLYEEILIPEATEAGDLDLVKVLLKELEENKLLRDNVPPGLADFYAAKMKEKEK